MSYCGNWELGLSFEAQMSNMPKWKRELDEEQLLEWARNATPSEIVQTVLMLQKVAEANKKMRLIDFSDEEIHTEAVHRRYTYEV